MQCSITFYVNKLISFRKRYLYVHNILNAKWYLPLRSENKRVLLIKSPEMVKKYWKHVFSCFDTFRNLYDYGFIFWAIWQYKNTNIQVCYCINHSIDFCGSVQIYKIDTIITFRIKRGRWSWPFLDYIDFL